MRNARPTFVVFLPLLGLSACGSGSIPIGDLGDKLLDESCTRAVRCGEYPDKATCLASNSRIVDLGQLEADVSAGKVTYDGSKAADCLSVIFARGCTITEQLAPVSSQACDDTFKGTVATGGTCFSEEECVSQSCDRSNCATALTCCAGTCNPPVTASIASGGNCLPAGSVCVTGTFCKRDPTGSNATCTPQVARGQPCTTLVDECVVGNICNTDPVTGNGTCGKVPVEGEPCPDGLCDASSDACDAATRTCVRRIAIGGACPSGSGCVRYANCDTATLTCVPRASKGGACTTTGDCLGSLTCTNGVCVDAPAAPVCM
jgi:hypothetical protein